MNGSDQLGARFEEERPRLRNVAYRMLGSLAEADDVVQEAWLRLSRTDVSEIENLPAWLTTVVGRLCLNGLRTRTHRGEEPLDVRPVEPTGGPDERRPADPEEEAVLADSVGLAMLVVLDHLGPAERFAFVLHDMFAVSFEEIAPMMDRTPASTRQLASRARRRVQGVTPADQADPVRRRAAVDAYLTASRGGDFDALVALLDPDVVLTADAAVAPSPTPIRLSGDRVVARAALASVERAQVTEAVLIDGVPGLVMAPLGHLTLALTFGFGPDGRMTAVDVIAEPDRLAKLEIALLPQE